MNELEKRVCIVSIDTLQELFEYWSDCVSLYMFYYKQCKIQKTNQTRTTDGFIMKWLKRGEKRLKKSKDILVKKWLIEFIQERVDGKFSKSYVKLNYIRSEAKTDRTIQKSETVGVGTGWQRTNAWSDKKEMLKVIKEKTYSDDFALFWKAYPLKKWKAKSFERYKQQLKYTTNDVLLDSAMLYAKECKGKEKTYIKRAEWRLNSQRRADYEDQDPIELFESMVFPTSWIVDREWAQKFVDKFGREKYDELKKEFDEKTFKSLL